MGFRSLSTMDQEIMQIKMDQGWQMSCVFCPDQPDSLPKKGINCNQCREMTKKKKKRKDKK